MSALACHIFKWKRFLFSLFDLHSSLATLSLSPLSKATNIRGEASVGQGQSFALTEHKCITGGLNYLGITRCVVPRHCASHNRFKQVENVFRREQQHQPHAPSAGNPPLICIQPDQLVTALWRPGDRNCFPRLGFMITVDDNAR